MKRTFAAATSSLDDVSHITDAAYFSSSTPAFSRQYAIKEGKYGGCKNIYVDLAMWVKQASVVLLKLSRLPVVGNPALM